MSEPVRLIRGRRSDSDDPGGEVVAIVYAPEPVRWKQGDPACRIRCRFLRKRDMHIGGVDDAQRLQTAIWLTCYLLGHRGVRGLEVSIIPPEDRSRAILQYGFHGLDGALRKQFRYP